MLPIRRGASQRLVSLLQLTNASRPHSLAQSHCASTTAREVDKVTVNDPVAPKDVPEVPSSNDVPVSLNGVQPGAVAETPEQSEALRQMQAPNRRGIWSRSQQPRERAMTGPRFEQTFMEYQPRPQAAVELIHKQPVRWSEKRVVSCDGGGGPLGHPRIFINLDKPQVNFCTYCGIPFANEHHREHLASLPSTPYPLEPQNDPVEVAEPQKITDEAFAQR